MGRLESYTFENSKGQFVKFFEGNNLVAAGTRGKVDFFVKPDGSSSVGGGSNGLSFFALNDTPTGAKINGILGSDGKNLKFVDEIKLKKINVDNLEVKKSKTEELVSNKVDADLVATKKIIADEIAVNESIKFEDLEGDHGDFKSIDTLSVKAVDVVISDSLLAESIDLTGDLRKSEVTYGSLDAPLSISKADGNTFSAGNKRRLTLYGRHYNKTLEVIVNSNIKNLWRNHIIRADVIDLAGQELVVVGKGIRKLDENTFKVRFEFNNNIRDNDKLMKIVIDIE